MPITNRMRWVWAMSNSWAQPGIWLGIEGVLFALSLGAFAGLIHGLGYAVYISWKDKTPVNLHRLAIPAGPGFAVGIIAVGSWMYKDFIWDVISRFVL